MKEPQRYSLATGLPQKEEDIKVPMPSLYPEKMSNDVYSTKEESTEQAFSNFIQKAKESKRKYEAKLAKNKKESNQN
tara:strand:+ start:4142 stop:4372 length:231 start_codon:yes stop_codon:yes gene_type:complete